MVFSSITFLFYFLPLFFLIYYITGRRFKNVVILLGSIYFYAWGAPRFIFVILGTTALDFYAVRGIAASRSQVQKKLLLICSLCLNLGLLFYFKYSNFFVENVNHLLHQFGFNELIWTKLILPIGISFYTFETLTYVVDVYKDIHKPLRNFWEYQLYIILFPKLIAGPIIRYHDFAEQIYDHTTFETPENRLRGFYRFCIGLGKKVLIANVVGANADYIFNIPASDLGTSAAWYGAISYSLQIYFDFSGYSDMAIGLGLMMGFRFPENFNNPYTSVSVTDFWRRWHMTLGNWMRNYLYIPLGGNRVNSKWRLYFNLCLVFLASGLWHGAAWGFIFWGAYHGFFLVIERLFLGRLLARIGKASILYTFFVVMIGWVFFRAVDIGKSFKYLHTMYSSYKGNNLFLWYPDRYAITILILGIFFSFFTIGKWGQKIQEIIFYKDHSIMMHFVMITISLILFVLSAARITESTFNPFIYFRF